jgi:hypothetical protein
MRARFIFIADLQAGTAFNDLEIGDAVTFELLEDAVSGARAARGAPRAASMSERPGESSALP